MLLDSLLLPSQVVHVGAVQGMKLLLKLQDLQEDLERVEKSQSLVPNLGLLGLLNQFLISPCKLSGAVHVSVDLMLKAWDQLKR